MDNKQSPLLTSSSSKNHKAKPFTLLNSVSKDKSLICTFILTQIIEIEILLLMPF